MKGIIQAMTFYILMLGISVGLMYYISIDLLRSQSIFILKQGMTETLQVLSKVPIDQRSSQLSSALSEAFNLRKPSQEIYKIDLIEFSASPLALRLALNVYPKYRPEGLWYRFEEILIEVENP